MASRALRNAIKRYSYKMFRLGQRLGFDLLPRHFYSSIPDVRDLQRTSYWHEPLEMVGVSGIDLESQLTFLRACCPPDLAERMNAMDLVAYGTRENGEIGYGPIETEFLYGFIQAKRPPRVVQVGAGFSTAIILRAAADAGFPIEIICVDPFPTEYLKRSSHNGKIKLIAEMAQTVNRDILTNVGEHGLLFIDSTHTVKVGSEVNRLILDILPRLPSGAYVHFHDIFFPYDHKRSLFSDPFFPGESTLLHAFLINNARYAVRCSLSMLHYAATEELRRLLPHYNPEPNEGGLSPPCAKGHFPSAIYLQVTG